MMPTVSLSARAPCHAAEHFCENTENLKIKQVQSESLATSFRSACSKSKFDVERFPLESGYASLDFQKRNSLLLCWVGFLW